MTIELKIGTRSFDVDEFVDEVFLFTTGECIGKMSTSISYW